MNVWNESFNKFGSENKRQTNVVLIILMIKGKTRIKHETPSNILNHKKLKMFKHFINQFYLKHVTD